MHNSNLVKAIAEDHISKLLALAEEEAKENTEQSRALEKRYVRLAQRISAHYKVKISAKLKSRICKKCGNFLVPGVNCKVRISRLSGKKLLIYICECGAKTKVVLKE